MNIKTPENVGIELSAVIVAVTRNEPQVMLLPSRALPSGPFSTHHRTLEQGLRAWVDAHIGLKLGYVEQLYTFADKDRTADNMRAVSIGYLALARAPTVKNGDQEKETLKIFPWYDFFPWEDRRKGVPAVTDHILKALTQWKAAAPDAATRKARDNRIAINFPKDPRAWNEELVLQRYELLWEAGLIEEAQRHFLSEKSVAGKHGKTPSPLRGGLGRGANDWAENMALYPKNSAKRMAPTPNPSREGRGIFIPGLSMPHDHRRILATGIARLRAKIKYRPVVFELMAERFTLLQLQNTVEALAGLRLHKQNFRRLVQGQGLVEETSGTTSDTRGRPAKLFAFRHDVLRERAAAGTKLPRSG